MGAGLHVLGEALHGVAGHVEHLHLHEAGLGRHDVQVATLGSELEARCGVSDSLDADSLVDALEVVHVEVVEFRLEYIGVSVGTDNFPGNLLDVRPVQVDLRLRPGGLLEFFLLEGYQSPFACINELAEMVGVVRDLAVLQLDGVGRTLVAVADYRAVAQVDTQRGVGVRVETEGDERVVRVGPFVPDDSLQADKALRAVGRVGRTREHDDIAGKCRVVDVRDAGESARILVRVGVPGSGRIEDFVAVFDIVDDEEVGNHDLGGRRCRRNGRTGLDSLAGAGLGRTRRRCGCACLAGNGRDAHAVAADVVHVEEVILGLVLGIGNIIRALDEPTETVDLVHACLEVEMLVVVAPVFLLELFPGEFNFLPILGGVLFHIVEIPVRYEGCLDAELVTGTLVLVADGVAAAEVDEGRVLLEVQAECYVRSITVGASSELDALEADHILGGVLATIGRHKYIKDFLAEVVLPLVVLEARFSDTVFATFISIGPCRPETTRVGIAVAVFHIVNQVCLYAVCDTRREAAVIGAIAILEAAVTVAALAVHPALDHLARLGVGEAVVDVQLVERSGTFVHGRSRPVGPRNIVLVHPVNPSLACALVGTAVTVGVDRTPFRCENWNSCFDGIVCATRVVPACRVGVCVEVERAGEILLGVLNAGRSALFRMAGPFRAANEHEVVRVLADSRNHRVCMRSDGTHGSAVLGFVPHFENHVVVGAVLLGGKLEELDGVVSVSVAAFDVPVDNHVDVVVDGGVHHVHEHCLLEVFTASEVATALVEFIIFYTHGKTDDFDIHLTHHVIDCGFVVEERSTVRSGTPEKAHALHLHGRILVLRARTGELAAIGLEFPVCADGAQTACTDGHGRYCSQAKNC